MTDINQKDPIINDAVHGVMRFPKESRDLIKSIIDIPIFQRLRHIKQLGMAELVFPTATHNRFSHSLGAAYTAYKMAKTLNLEDECIKYSIVSALLHDIGHGPFSHIFEKLLIHKDQVRGDISIKHEDWTEEFLIQEFKNKIEVQKLCYEVVNKLITKKYIKVVNNSSKNKNYNIVSDIISSQLDADRLDYLLRDSHFCGVPIGNIDINWIISNLVEINETGNPPRLGIFKKGVRAVEHYLIARKLFYQTVCHHQKIRIFEELLKFFLIELSNSELLQNADYDSRSLYKFLENVKKFREGEIDKNQFIKDNYHHYSRLTDMDVWVAIKYFALATNKKYHGVNEIAKLIYDREPHKYFSFNKNCIGAVESILKEVVDRLKLEKWEMFVINTPVTMYEREEDPILVKNETNRIFRIQEYSELLSLMGNKLESNCGLAVSIEVWNKNEIRNVIVDELKKYIIFPE